MVRRRTSPTSDRRLLLFQFRTADAWPLLGFPGGIEKFKELMVRGVHREPRLEHVPVRLPLPPAKLQGSLYENQKGMKSRFFAHAGRRARAGAREVSDAAPKPVDATFDTTRPLVFRRFARPGGLRRLAARACASAR